MPLIDMGMDDSLFGPARGGLAGLRSSSLLGGGKPPPAHRAPLDDGAYEGLAGSLTRRAGSALTATLDALALPGDHVRGLLAGNPGTRTTGRQLADSWGLTPSWDKGWGSWGIGLAADLATDPLSYVGLGTGASMTRGGQALAKTGALKGWGRKALIGGFEDTESAMLRRGLGLGDIEHAIDAGTRVARAGDEAAFLKATGRELVPGEPLSGLVGVGLPFGRARATLGTGPIARGIAGGLDAAGDRLWNRTSLGRHVGSLFNHAQNRSLSEHGTRAMKGFGQGVFDDAMTTARGEAFDFHRELDDLVRANPGRESDVLAAAMANAEGTASGFLDPAMVQATQAAGSKIAAGNRRMMAEAEAKGLPLRSLSDEFASYLARDIEDIPGGMRNKGQSAFPVRTASNMHREDVFRDIPGGTARLNQWVAKYAGHRDVDAVRDALAADMRSDLGELAARTGAAPSAAHLAAIPDKAGALAARLMDFDPARAQAGTGLYSLDLPGVYMRRAGQHASTMRSGDAAIRAIADAATVVPPGPGGSLADEYLLASDALKAMNLVTRDTDAGPMGALAELRRRLAPKGAAGGPLPTTATDLSKELGDFALKRDAFHEIARDYAGWAAPEELARPLRLWDSAANLFKGLTYPIWPASHVRNLTTAMVNNARYGTGFRDYLKQYRLMRGLLDPAEAMDLTRSQYAHAGLFTPQGHDTEILGGALTPNMAGRSHMAYAPGTSAATTSRAGTTGSLLGDTAQLTVADAVGGTVRDIFRKIRHPKTAPNPLAMKGVDLPSLGLGNGEVDRFRPVRVGRAVGQNVEDFARGAQYNALIRQGYTPDMAAKEIFKVHFDYGAVTPFERDVMRRVVPFYSFARGNLPLQVDTLLTRPRIFSAPFAPLRQDRHRQGYTPDWISANAAMPLNGAPAGQQRFLSSLGLPQEEALERFKTLEGLPDLTGTLMGFASMLNPAIKAPLEQLSDRQFFSGRRLSDLKPTGTASALGELFHVESPQLLSQALANSPLARTVTTIDRLMDPRKSAGYKALNLATGARVTDVDIDKARTIEARNALEDMLRRQPHVRSFTNYYADPTAALNGDLSADEVEQLRMLSAMQKRARAYAARRQKEGAGR